MENFNYIKINRSESFKEKFLKKDKKFRIEAVIHDGQWYTISKWAKVSCVNKSEIEEYISKTDIISKKESYRKSYSQIIDWYKKNNLDITMPIVPNNFVPILWGDKTEVEHFENAPRRIISSLMIKCPDTRTMSKIKHILNGYGELWYENGNKYYIHSINPLFLKEKIKRELNEEDFMNISLRVRCMFKKREISDLDDVYLRNSILFYYTLVQKQLALHKKTIKIFLPNVQDQKAQIVDWILEIIQKYDENSCVPFPGYLSSVIEKKPYDLPDIYLGRPLAKFQRVYSKAFDRLTQKYERNNFSDEEIMSEMGYKKERFEKFNQEHIRWLSVNNPLNIHYDKKNNENTIVFRSMVRSQKQCESSKLECSRISFALLNSFIDTNDFESFYSILKEFGKKEISEDMKVSEDFKKSFYKNLKKGF